MKKYLFLLTCVALAASFPASVEQKRADVTLVAPLDGVGSISDVALQLTSKIKIEATDLAECSVLAPAYLADHTMIRALQPGQLVMVPQTLSHSETIADKPDCGFRRFIPSAQACAVKVRCS